MSQKVQRPPVADVAAVRRGDADALVNALIACAARWFAVSGSNIASPLYASQIASAEGTAKAGLMAAASELRALLSESPSGREALRNFGFELSAIEVASPVGCNAKCAEPKGFDSLGMPIYPQESSSGARQ